MTKPAMAGGRLSAAIEGSAVLITRATCGLKALVDEGLRQGTRRVYAGTGQAFTHAARGEDDIFPDPVSESMADSWRNSWAEKHERQRALLVGPAPVRR